MDRKRNDVERMMELLDEMPKMQASPGFYQRTKYKLDHMDEAARDSFIDKLLKFTLTPALIGISIALGIFIGLGDNSIQNSKAIDAIIETYNMQTTDVQQIFIIE